jgi:hypothetical protein
MEAVPRPLGGESWFTSRSLIERIVLFAKHADADGGLVKVRFGLWLRVPAHMQRPGLPELITPRRRISFWNRAKSRKAAEQLL